NTNTKTKTINRIKREEIVREKKRERQKVTIKANMNTCKFSMSKECEGHELCNKQ
ncbi:hypothetical protein C0J52_12783, partial [Blattella germanica]